MAVILVLAVPFLPSTVIAPIPGGLNGRLWETAGSTYELRTGMLESQRRHTMAITRTEDLTYQLLREELEFAGTEQEKL